MREVEVTKLSSFPLCLLSPCDKLTYFSGKIYEQGKLRDRASSPCMGTQAGQTPGTPAPDLSVRTKGTALLADSSSNTLVSLWIICSGKRGRMYLASVHVLSVITRCSCIAFLCITGFKFQFFFLPYSFAAAGQALKETCAVATSVIFPALQQGWAEAEISSLIFSRQLCCRWHHWGNTHQHLLFTLTAKALLSSPRSATQTIF